MKITVRILKKLAALVLGLLVLSVLVFTMSRLAPTDPLQAYYGDRTEKMSAAEKEAARQRLGLNDSLPVQYVRWLKLALKGDFGISYQYKQPVTRVISQRIGNTLILGGLGFLLTFAGALALGTLCAWYEDRWPDKILCKLGTVSSCIPEFWLSLMLILIFSVTLRWLPSSGAYTIGRADDLLDRAVHLILPITVVILSHLWYYAYLVRSKLLEETRREYVLLARAKGLSRKAVLLRHCLPAILPSYFSLMAISVPHILGGTYLVEAVFSYPGIGTLCYESARYADYNLLMLLCLMTGGLVMVSALLGQAVSARIDPRLRSRDGKAVTAHE